MNWSVMIHWATVPVWLPSMRKIELEDTGQPITIVQVNQESRLKWYCGSPIGAAALIGALWLAGPVVQADELKLIAAVPMTGVVKDLGSQFERSSRALTRHDIRVWADREAGI